MSITDAFQKHLASGATSLCTCWAIARRDGEHLGFTDHDHALSFEGVIFRADTGLSASALSQSTGLAVDNTEAIGALSDTAIKEEDIDAGRYDGAEIRIWRVNWQDVSERVLSFRGLFGELRRKGPAFEVEIRGLSELLNRPIGRVYQKPCSAVLGDRSCGKDLAALGYRYDAEIIEVERQRVVRIAHHAGFEKAWFLRGRLDVLSGNAKGLWSTIKRDAIDGNERIVELFEPIRAPLQPKDHIRLTAGCDKRFETCRLKFQNAINFQGFPDLVPEDWQMISPQRAGRLDGGSRR